MQKLLGYAYEREWQDHLKDWQDTQEVGRNRHLQMTSVHPSSDPNQQTEYAVSFGKRTTVIHPDNRYNFLFIYIFYYCDRSTIIHILNSNLFHETTNFPAYFTQTSIIMALAMYPI